MPGLTQGVLRKCSQGECEHPEHIERFAKYPALDIPIDFDERAKWRKTQAKKWLPWMDGNLFQNWTLEEGRCDNCQCLSLVVMNTEDKAMRLCLDLCLATGVEDYPTGAPLTVGPEEMIAQHSTSLLSSLISAYSGRLNRAFTSSSPQDSTEKSSSTVSSPEKTKTTTAPSSPSPLPNLVLSTLKSRASTTWSKLNSGGQVLQRPSTIEEHYDESA